MEHSILPTAHPAKPSATDQPPDGAADNEWTRDQLRLLHQTLTHKLRLADMRSEIMARAGSGTAVLQVSLPVESLPVRPQSGLSQQSGSGLHHKGVETACNDAKELAAAKTDTVAAETAAANGDTASLSTAGMSSSPQKSAAHSTGCTPPADSDRTQPSAGNSSPTATQHRGGTSLSPQQHHTRQRSDKPARAKPRHKSWRIRSPQRSRRQTAEHSTRRTGPSSPARRHLRASSKLKGSIGKHAGSSASPAGRIKTLASHSQSPARLRLSAAKHTGSSKPISQKRNSQHSRLNTRCYRSPSRHGSPRIGSRAKTFRSAKGKFADTSFRDRQRYAEAGATHSGRWRSLPMLPDDPERHFSSRSWPPWHSPPGSGRISAAVPPDSHSGAQPPPWSFPSPPQSWDDLGVRHMRSEPYSPPRRFNMGVAPRKRQSADHASEVRSHCWSSPRGGVKSPTRCLPSPRSYFPGLGNQISSPRDSLASPSNSMPTGDVFRRRGSRWGPRDHSLSPRDRSLSPRDCSFSPRDRSSNPRDSSPSHLSNEPDCSRICRQHSTHTSTQEYDHLHMARAAANRPLGASPGPVPDSPAYYQLDLPGHNSPNGYNSCLVGSCQPAHTSPDVSYAVASQSAASYLSPLPLADSPLQQGPQALVYDAQKPSQHAAAGPQAEQVELQLHSPVAKRRLDMHTADTAARETLPVDSSKIESDSATALRQTDLKGSLPFPDSHAVVSDASETPPAQTHDGADAVPMRHQRPKQGHSSLLKKVLRKSLATQDVNSKGLSGSDAEQASCNSSQFVFQTCSESADAQRPQHAELGEQADARKSCRAKGPQPAEPRDDSRKQAHVQTSFHDDRAKRESKSKSKRCRQSSGGHTAVLGQPRAAAAAAANSWTDDVVFAEQHWKGKDDMPTWAEALDREGPLELDALCWFYLDPFGKARGQYSLHMFMSWLHNLEKDNFDRELAAFKETTVWTANMTTRVPLMALLHHFETCHAASWEQTTA